MKTDKKYIGKVVYVMGYSPDANIGDDGTMRVFQNRAELTAFLDKKTPTKLSDITIVHGVLTKATSIPSEIDNLTDIYLLIPYGNQNMDGFIIQCADLEQLETLVRIVTGHMDNAFAKVEDIMSIDMQDIENLYVLYGYEPIFKYALDEKSIDEDIIKASRDLYKTIKARQISD